MNIKNKLLLFGILLIGGSLRLLYACKMPYMGDECGTMINICYSSKYILTHFHCWLTMNWYILFTKMLANAFGEGFVSIRFISIVTGTGAIVLTGLIFRRLFPSRNWLLPAAMVSFNPFLIFYSANARVYAVFTFCALLLWLFFLLWRDNPNWKNSIGLALSCFFLLLFNLNGIFVILWLVVIIALEILRSMHASDKHNPLWPGLKRLFIPSALCMISAGLYYLQLFYEIRRYSQEWLIPGVSSIKYVPNTITVYFGTKSIAWLFIFFMLLGILQAFRWDRYKCLSLVLWIVLPVLTAAILGYSFKFWDYARFFIFVLPGILIFCSIGIDTLASLFGKKIYTIALPLAGLGFLIAWLPTINNRLEQGALMPFHNVFSYISKHAREQDRIISLDPLTRLHLSPYMNCDERAAVEQDFNSKKVYLCSTVPDLLQDTERGRMFLVSSGRHIPRFNSETVSFGDLRVSILNPESKAERYTRLLSGYEGAAKVLETKKNPKNDTDICTIYSSLSDLAKFRGDLEKEKYYKSFVEGS